MKFQIGSEKYDSVYIHTIDFISERGFIEQADPLIKLGGLYDEMLGPTQKLIGSPKTVGPSPVQTVSCSEDYAEIRCIIKPLRGKGEHFKVAIATNAEPHPTVYLAAKNIELESLESGNINWLTTFPIGILIVGSVFGFILPLTLGLVEAYRERRTRFARRDTGL